MNCINEVDVSVKFTASLIVRSYKASFPIVDVSHPQLVLERSYSWPHTVGLYRAFRLMMGLTGMTFVALVTLVALVALVTLVVVRMVDVSMMAARLTLLLLLASLARLLVLPISAAWPRA